MQSFKVYLSRMGFGLAALAASVSGCATVPPHPKVDLQEPGWTVRQGQAVWRMEHGTREITGDLLVATGPKDRTFVQFSKTPFPLVIAQRDRNRWEVEFPPQSKHYSGRGQPPKRIIWLYLARVVAGEPPPQNWTWRNENGRWQLANRATVESVEGYFKQ